MPPCKLYIFRLTSHIILFLIFCSHLMCPTFLFPSFIHPRPGRSSISKSNLAHELQAPTLIFPSIFGKTKIAFIATSPTACHSIAITSDGKAYGWGRNETGQLGLGHSSACVPLPTLLSVGEDDVTFVGAGVGKFHTILVGSNGLAYGSGGNICGQLGINNTGSKGIDKFRKCVVMGQISGGGDGEEDDDESKGNVKIVQVSFVLGCVWSFCLDKQNNVRTSNMDTMLYTERPFNNMLIKYNHTILLCLQYRHPAEKTSRPSYPPPATSTPPAPPNSANSATAKRANTLSPPAKWDTPTAPNSCAVPSLSKARPIGMVGQE